MALSYGDLEAIITRVHRVSPDKLQTFRARLQQFQRLGIPAGANKGRGKRVEYSLEQLLQAALAFEIVAAGAPPSLVTRIVGDKWPLCAYAILRTMKNVLPPIRHPNFERKYKISRDEKSCTYLMVALDCLTPYQAEPGDVSNIDWFHNEVWLEGGPRDVLVGFASNPGEWMRSRRIHWRRFLVIDLSLFVSLVVEALLDIRSDLSDFARDIYRMDEASIRFALEQTNPGLAIADDDEEFARHEAARDAAAAEPMSVRVTEWLRDVLGSSSMAAMERRAGQEPGNGSGTEA